MSIESISPKTALFYSDHSFSDEYQRKINKLGELKFKINSQIGKEIK